VRSTRVLVAAIATVLVIAGIVNVRNDRQPGGSRPIRALVQGATDRLGTTGSGSSGVSKPVSGSAVGHPVHVGRRDQALPHGPSWSTRETQVEPEADAGELRGIETSVGVENGPDAAQQPDTSLPGVAKMQGFQGLNFRDNGGRSNWSIPPDTNGAIGNGFYLQMVNTVFAVWNVTGTPTLLPGYPTKISSVFPAHSGLGMCSTHDDGDPVVVYDTAADRFVISQFALNFRQERYFECIAVSQSGDLSTGLWWSYAFEYPRAVMNDYPKLGVWPDGYYASFNQFDVSRGFAWAGGGAIAFERDAMLTGGTARFVYFNLYPIRRDLGGMLPSNWIGATPPPVEAPNIFDMFDADERGWNYRDDQVELWGFHVDYDIPSNSTFTRLQRPISVANFNPWICGFARVDCVPQKDSTVKLDSLLGESMFPLQYRNDGTNQHLVFTHSVRSNQGASGIRWYDLTRPTDESLNWGVGNQGTYAPDPKYRWMGSAAINNAGDVAIGFSISSRRIVPKVGVAGRLAGDPVGQMTSDSTVYPGAGSERGKYGRWGDYSSMGVDPTDDCTFWYTNQYYKTTSQWHWGTWIQSFQLPGQVC
jgi:hypothetical protein